MFNVKYTKHLKELVHMNSQCINKEASKIFRCLNLVLFYDVSVNATVNNPNDKVKHVP